MTGRILMLCATVLVAPAVLRGGEFEYIGAAKCKKCHLKQYKSWEATAMASAFELLKPGVAIEAKTAAGIDPSADYTRDARCLSCHVTGYGQPGGFVDIDTTPHLAGVGCEACHGPGGTYTKDGYMTLDNKEYVKAEIVAAGMVDTVGEAQCVSCHNGDNPLGGEAFDFAVSRDEGTHEHFPLKYSH